jgi:hypothetical protein
MFFGIQAGVVEVGERLPHLRVVARGADDMKEFTTPVG